jgi:hypothetical protein
MNPGRGIEKRLHGGPRLFSTVLVGRAHPFSDHPGAQQHFERIAPSRPFLEYAMSSVMALETAAVSATGVETKPNPDRGIKFYDHFA